MEMHNKISAPAEEIAVLYLAGALPRLTREEEHKQQAEYNPPPDSGVNGEVVRRPSAPQLSIAFAFHFLQLPSSASEHEPCKGQAMLRGQTPAPQVSMGREGTSPAAPALTTSRGITECTRKRSGLKNKTKAPPAASQHSQPRKKQVMLLHGYLDQDVQEEHHSRQAVVQTHWFYALEKPRLPPHPPPSSQKLS